MSSEIINQVLALIKQEKDAKEAERAEQERREESSKKQKLATSLEVERCRKIHESLGTQAMLGELNSLLKTKGEICVADGDLWYRSVHSSGSSDFEPGTTYDYYRPTSRIALYFDNDLVGVEVHRSEDKSDPNQFYWGVFSGNMSPSDLERLVYNGKGRMDFVPYNDRVNNKKAITTSLATNFFNLTKFKPELLIAG